MQNNGKVLLVAAVSLTLVVLPALAADEEKGVQEKRYITAQGIAGTCLVQENLSIGNACFRLQENSTRLSIEVDDDYFDIVYGNYRIYDGPWDEGTIPEILDEGNFCSGTELDLPEEARYIIVFVDGHVGTPVQCDDGVGQGASIGSIIIEEWNEEDLSTMR